MDIVESDVIPMEKTNDSEDSPEHKVWQSNRLVYGLMKTTIGAMGYRLIQNCATA